MILDTFETAEYLNINHGTLSNSRSTGILLGYPTPPYIKTGKKILYKKSELDAWLSSLPTYSNTQNKIK